MDIICNRIDFTLFTDFIHSVRSLLVAIHNCGLGFKCVALRQKNNARACICLLRYCTSSTFDADTKMRRLIKQSTCRDTEHSNRLRRSRILLPAYRKKQFLMWLSSGWKETLLNCLTVRVFPCSPVRFPSIPRSFLWAVAIWKPLPDPISEPGLRSFYYCLFLPLRILALPELPMKSKK